MGEVYRARDIRLQREVALKILPEAFAGDPDRLARFEREAQVLASLNHPHIAALYGFEESSGTRALVLELVEGMTLADRIVGGALPLHESLPIAKQIALALEAAHERGIVHRDLKPANIKITADGTVKVLDFGLAKNLAPVRGAADMSLSPTITTPAMTLAGVILGSAAYMSPEQAKGREADKRSDVWAFGCVLFEMLTGTRAFDAEDVSETLAAVLMRDPDWSRLSKDLPASIRTMLQRCLERDRRRRMGDIAGALLAMDDSLVATRSAPVAAGSDARRWLLRLAIVATAGVLAGALAAGGAVWRMTRPAVSTDVVRFQVSAPSKTELFTSQPSTFAISPDGRTLAFTTGAIGSERQLWIRSLGSTSARLVPGVERPSALTWSPDSQSIVYTAVAGGAMGPLKRVDLRSGSVITLTDAGAAGAWSAKGDVLFRGGDGRLYQIAGSGGTARAVTELDKTLGEVAHHAAFFLRDGRRFVFQAQSSDPTKSAVYLSSLDSTDRVKLLNGLTGARAESGFLLYRRESAVMAQPFDEDNGRLTGDAKPLIEAVEYNAATGSAYFSVSETGALVYRTSNSTAISTLTWLDDGGRAVGRIGLEGDYTSILRPSLSNDGRRLAVSRHEGQSRSDIWVIDLDRDVPAKFTSNPADDDSPIFTADGSRIVYRSTRNGQQDLYQKGSGGAGVEELLNDSEGAKRPTGLSPNGEVLLLSVSGRRSNEIWGLSMKGPAKPFTLVSTGFPSGMAVFSPNGRWFAYCEGDSGADQVYVQPYPTNGKRWRLSPDSGSSPQWSADGKAVFFTRTDNHVMRVEVTEVGDELRPGVAEDLFLAPGTFEHRGVLRDPTRKRFLVPVPRDQYTAALDVVVNWPALLREN